MESEKEGVERDGNADVEAGLLAQSSCQYHSMESPRSAQNRVPAQFTGAVAWGWLPKQVR